MIQRYDMAAYQMGYQKNDDGEVCMSRDVEELEAKYQKLLREHTFMITALQWIADDGSTLYKKKQIAINSLRYVNAQVTL